MAEEFMQIKPRKRPEIIVFAGPNGSGKSTVTEFVPLIQPYINADEIKKTLLCSDMEAAQKADALRRQCIEKGQGFTFETVLSTERNLNLLRLAKEKGYFIRCVYVLTADPLVNVFRVKTRKASGGHDVPPDRVIARYHRALKLIPQLLEVCDVCHIYDNTVKPLRIFKKRKTEDFYWANDLWNKAQIQKLTGSTHMKVRGY